MDDRNPAGYLTLEQILEAPDVAEEDVDVPEWGGKVKVRGFSKDVEMACRAEARTEDGETDRRKLELLFLVHGIVEPDMDESATESLAKKSAAACNRVLRVVMRLNGQDQETREERERDFRSGRTPAVPVYADGAAAHSDEEAAAASAL